MLFCELWLHDPVCYLRTGVQNLGHPWNFNYWPPLVWLNTELQMQKTRVNTGYSGHTLTSTLPAPMKELNELLRQTKTSLMKLLTFPLSSVYKNELWVITCHMFFSKVLPLNVEIARSAALSL